MQIVSVELDPGETVIAEAGAMNWMDEGITFEARTGDGSQPNQDFFGKLTFSDVGAIVYCLRATPWLVPGFSVDTHLDGLLALQAQVERGEPLSFRAGKYFIEAQKPAVQVGR